MTAPYRVTVVSNYIYEPDPDKPYASMGKANRWINGFVKGLVRQGSGLAALDMQFARLPDDPADDGALASRLRDEGRQLVICPGTDGAIRWTRACDDIPTLYFGAHPDNHGIELCTRKNVGGVRLNLPLIWSWDQFSLLKAVLPGAKRLYAPLNLTSEFAFPGIRTIFELHRKQSDSIWVPGGSPYTGYRACHFLCQRLGIDYFEGPYTSPDELSRAFAEVSSGPENIVLGFNDTLLMPGAPEALFERVRAQDLPLVWVNNAAVIRREGVMDFSSHFEKVGGVLAKLAMQHLRDGASMAEVGYHPDPGVRSLLNTGRLRALGVEVAADARRGFDDVA